MRETPAFGDLPRALYDLVWRENAVDAARFAGRGYRLIRHSGRRPKAHELEPRKTTCFRIFSCSKDKINDYPCFSTGRRGWLAGKIEVLGIERVAALDNIRVVDDAVYRADFNALRGVKMADALGTQLRVYKVDVLALGDGAVRALRLAYIAVDALVGNEQRHGEKP